MIEPVNYDAVLDEMADQVSRDYSEGTHRACLYCMWLGYQFFNVTQTAVMGLYGEDHEKMAAFIARSMQVLGSNDRYELRDFILSLKGAITKEGIDKMREHIGDEETLKRIVEIARASEKPIN